MIRPIYLICILVLHSCGGQYIEREDYEVELVTCDNDQASFGRDYIDAFESNVDFLNIVPRSTENIPPSNNPGLLYTGPYGIAFTLKEKYREQPSDIIIRDINIESSLDRNYDQLLSGELPIVLSATTSQFVAPLDYTNPFGWECGLRNPDMPESPICRYLSRRFLSGQLFDFQYEENEELKIEIEVEDLDSNATGTICYQALPKLNTETRDYSIGV